MGRRTITHTGRESGFGARGRQSSCRNRSSSAPYSAPLPPTHLLPPSTTLYFTFPTGSTPPFGTSPPFLLPPHRPTFQTVLRRLTEMRQALPGPTPPFSAYEIITDVMEQLAEKKVKSQKRKVSDACARMQLVATPCTSTHSHYVHTYATMWLPGPLSRCLNDAFDPTHCPHL